MEKELLTMLEDFNLKVGVDNDAISQYSPMLRDYFIPYLLNNYQCKNMSSLFREEMTPNGLIDAAVFFIKSNENIRSKSRLNFFLSALTTLFNDFLFEKYPNPNIQKIHSFANLSDDICLKLIQNGITLNEKERNISIDDKQFRHIIKYLKEHPAKTLKQQQEHIIIKLYLLYGISPDKLALLPFENYRLDKKILQVPCSTRKDLYIDLELPYTLSNEVSEYISVKTNTDTTLLFEKETKKNIDSQFLTEILDKIRDDYYIKEKVSKQKNPFTPTGLQKYAIIKMIETGMNQSLIMDFTGQSQVIFNDCQFVVDEKKKLNRNRYINHMIRGIDTYDII